MITSVLTDGIYPRVNTVLSDKKHVDQFVQYVTRYVDRNSEKLSTIGPTKRVLFTDAERDNIFNLIGISRETIKTLVEQTDYIKGGTTPGDPFNIIMTMIIRYFRKNKMPKEQRAGIIYLTLSMYPSIHYKYFKYEPNEQIMEYTINNLSNKYKIKQTGTVLAALVETTVVSDEHYANALTRGNDKDIADYILSFKTRLNSLIKKICAEFMKQHKAGRYLNIEVDNNDPDNFMMADSNSYIITRISDAVSMQLSVSGPNMRLIQISAKLNQVSTNDLRNTIHNLCKDKSTTEDVKKVVSAILYLFLFDGNNRKEDLNGNKFLLFCMEVYKKSNTTDENIIMIKTLLDKWLNMYSTAYKKTNRVATVNSFRKALFTFFVFTIQRTTI